MQHFVKNLIAEVAKNDMMSFLVATTRFFFHQYKKFCVASSV